MSSKPGVLKARVDVFDSGRIVSAISQVVVRLCDWNKGWVRTDQPWGGHKQLHWNNSNLILIFVNLSYAI